MSDDAPPLFIWRSDGMFRCEQGVAAFVRSHDYEHVLVDRNKLIAERDQLLAALTELVECKRLKERAHGMNYKARGAPGRIRRDLLLEYERRKPLAWAAAERLIAGDKTE